MSSLSTLDFLTINPNPKSHFSTPLNHPNYIKIKAFSSPKSNLSTDPLAKKSFAEATGDFFLGFASRIIKNRIGGKGEYIEDDVKMFGYDDGVRENVFWRGEKEGIAAVLEDPLQPEVVWEQRLKDVEAESRRKTVSSPGFSFSAAGLLFPYHLGVAQLLIEKGYIKDDTPLAGSSAGAIVCAVVASGSSMQEALVATKVLAEDCRLRGTAFRLGAVLREVLVNFLPDDVHIRSNGRVRGSVRHDLDVCCPCPATMFET